MKTDNSASRRILGLSIGGSILIALAYATFEGSFSKGRMLILQECDLQTQNTGGWNFVKHVPLTYSLPPSFKWDAAQHKWTDGERIVFEGWIEHRGNSAPHLSYACKLSGRKVVLERGGQGDRIWFDLEFLDVTASAPRNLRLFVDGKKSDEALFESILKTARIAE